MSEPTSSFFSNANATHKSNSSNKPDKQKKLAQTVSAAPLVLHQIFLKTLDFKR